MTVTSYVPLLTVFTPPASCSDNSYTLDENDIYMKDINLESTDCYPDGFKDVWSASQPFSPGICPDLYSRASYNIAPWAMSGDIMEWLCCPGDMFAAGTGYSCITTVSSETELALPSGTVKEQNLIIAVHGIYVAVASSDAPLFATPLAAPSSSSTLAPSTSSSTSQSTLSTSTPTSTPASTRSFSTARQTTSQTSDAEGDMTSIPPGSPTIISASPSTTPHSTSRTTIGIAVGLSATLAVLAAILAFALISRRRRRNRASTYSNPLEVRVFGSASEFNEDKKKWWSWSPLTLSPSSPFFDRRHSHTEIVNSEKSDGEQGLGIEGAQEADSRAVMGREEGVGEVQEADSRCVIAELQGD